MLGAPVVPPSKVTVVANALRRRLLGAHRQAAPPPLRIIEALFGQFDAAVLAALVHLGLPDLLETPLTVTDIAAKTGSDRDRLNRVLRYAAARGFVGRDRRGRIAPNGVTRALRSDAVAPWRGWVRFATSEAFGKAWQSLPASLSAQAAIPFDAANGADFFAYHTVIQPEAGATFDQAMEAGATLQAIGLARTLDWGAVASVCDVGGGTGVALDVLQRYHPHLDVTLLDLPQVVGRARLVPRDQSPGKRVVVAGSFFDAIPEGHDRYILLAVIHDWDDEHAQVLLAKVRDAMDGASQAIVVENVASARPRDDFATASDLLMLVLATGRERTDVQYQTLFRRAQLIIGDRHVLPTGATAFVLAR